MAKRKTSKTPEELEKLDFDPGSMGPKVEAACLFARSPERAAGIGALADASRIVHSRAGTVIAASQSGD